MVDDINYAFRDYNVDGVPASGPYKPDKELIRVALNRFATESNPRLVMGRERAFSVHAQLASGANCSFAFFGDSTVINSGSYVPAAIRFDLLFKSILYERGIVDVTVANYAVGSTSWADIDVLGDIDASVHCVVIKTGLNDAAVGLDAMVENMRAELAAIRASRNVQSLTIVIVGPNAASDDANGVTESWVSSQRVALATAAEDYDCIFVDTYSYLPDVRGLALGAWINADGVHPRYSMHTQIVGLTVDAVLTEAEAAPYRYNHDLNLPLAQESPTNSAAPSTYKFGRSFHSVTSGNGFPISGVLLTQRHAGGGVTQTLVPVTENASGVRTRNGYVSGDSWGAWSGVATALTLQNSWVAFGSTYDAPSYFKTADGVVFLSGLMKNGTITAGTLIATLPVGFRPAADQIFVVQGSAAVVTVKVESDGEIRFSSNGDASYTTLAGISFLATP